jgi:hypothetical protein
MQAQDPSHGPQMLLMLGDQIYADEVSPRTKEFISARRDLDQTPGPEVLDVDEYTMLYHEAWFQPTLRWLHSVLPTVMLFDDHDVHDDWNTSESWTWVAHALARSAGVDDPEVRWRVEQPPTWRNQLGWLEIDGRHLTLTIETTPADHRPALEVSLHKQIA